MAREESARCRVPAGDEARRRSIPRASNWKPPAIIAPSTAQKSYNGVAILSRRRFDEVKERLDGDDADDHARYIEALVPTDTEPVRVISVYIPNGNPAPGPKYDYKLAWMERLKARVKALLVLEEPFAIAGDYNVIPNTADVWNPAAWTSDALFLPQTRAAFRSLLNLGLVDAFRACHAVPHRYSFWDYQAARGKKTTAFESTTFY